MLHIHSKQLILSMIEYIGIHVLQAHAMQKEALHTIHFSPIHKENFNVLVADMSATLPQILYPTALDNDLL